MHDHLAPYLTGSWMPRESIALRRMRDGREAHLMVERSQDDCEEGSEDRIRPLLGEVSQSMKYFPCTDEDLSSLPSIHKENSRPSDSCL